MPNGHAKWRHAKWHKGATHRRLVLRTGTPVLFCMQAGEEGSMEAGGGEHARGRGGEHTKLVQKKKPCSHLQAQGDQQGS